MASQRTLRHQFELAEQALKETRNLYRARYWTSCVSSAYQVALRAAAGLLYGLGANPITEREVRVGFAGAFVSPGRTEARFDQAFRRLEDMRQKADFDHDHLSTEAEAAAALKLAEEFWNEALRVQKEVLK